jgi:hypothetical protein
MTLVVVVWMRWTMPPEQVRRFANPGEGFRGGREMNGQWRRYREPATRYVPVAPLPKDLYRVEIEVSRKDYQTLLAYHWNGWQGGRGGGGPSQERPEVKVTVREGGVTYTDVALHPKGSAGSFRPFNDKPAMTLNFSKHKKGRTFHGYSKFSLNNSVQDPTYLSEAICREMFVAAGVPAPRVEHATVVVNGQDLGLYVLSEGWGKPFLRRHFKNEDGNLFDGGFVRDITEDLEVNSGDDKDSRADLDRLVEAASEPAPTKRWERLNEVLDMDRFVTFVAMEVLTCHWDGYSLNRNNYRVFHDRSTGKMVFLPHGLDQTFGVGRSSPTASIQPGMGGLVARAAIGTPMGRKRYLERIAELRATVLEEDKLTNRLWELARRIQPTLAAYSPEAASWHAAMVTDFAERIGERARSVSEQLTSPQQAFTFNEAGVARVTGWRPSLTGGIQGAARFHRETMNDAVWLHARMTEAGGVASWRSRVTLDSGLYRFEGRVKTKGVGTSGGVSLRVSGARVPLRVLEDDEWTLLSFGLQVEDILTEVELVCELRSNGGEAWFDEGSLRLVREP